MLDHLPKPFKLICLVAILLAGPVTVFAFLFGGATAGTTALVIVFFVFIILYMVGVRLYGKG